MTQPVSNIYPSLALWFVTMLTISLVQNALGQIAWVENNGLAITAGLLLYVPLAVFLLRREKPTYLSWSKKSTVTGLLWALIAAAVLFIPALAVNHVYQTFFLQRAWTGAWPVRWPSEALVQVALIAFPEEFFFRGYLLDRLEQVCARKQKIFGVAFGRPDYFCALIFALSHSMMSIQWWHALIFFPALVFGWLRVKTQGLIAPTLFHAACNLFSYFAFYLYRP